MKTVIFNENNRAYYIAKKARLELDNAVKQAAREDARFVLAYGMDAFMQLYPDALHQGMDWHVDLLKEVERLKRLELAENIAGMALATSAGVSKKSRSTSK